MDANEAYTNYCKASSDLKVAMDADMRQKALEYYRSEQRPLDEACRNKLRSIAEQMNEHLAKRVPVDTATLNKWSETLWKI